MKEWLSPSLKINIMGPHPEVPVDVQKYIGSYLITQQPRGKRKTCARQGGKDSRGAGYSGGAAAPICNSCCAPQVNKVRGYNGLNNYAWTGVPLISVANARQKTHLGNQKSRPTQRVKQPERLVDYSRHTESPDGSFTGGSSIGLEDILSISQLAIHAQGAPLIISPSEKEKGSEKDPRKDGEGYLLKGRNMFVSSNSTMYVMMNSPPEASHLPYMLDEEAVSGESDFKSDTSLSRQTSPSQSDCVSTTSEDSVTSENGLPRIIKPRKRRKKDRRVSDSGSDRFEDVGVGTAIVTLKPYQPLCYRYSEPAARQYLSADDLDNSGATVESPDEQQMSPEPSHYPCPSSLLCRCSYCVPSSVFLTPPQSPIESLVNCNKREHPFYEISSDVTNSRGHRDLEIKLFSQISNSSEDDDVNFEAGSSSYSYLQDNAPSTLLGAPPPPERPWVEQAKKSLVSSSCTFTVMCYNILCDKYATRQMYGYCPSWALEWLYRRKRIMDEIIHYRADILSLQEVETEQFYNFFLPELRKLGYDGIFSPKSRAKTMSENERRHVDGCAIFFKTSKFVLLKEHLVEFNQLAMANAEGSDDMLNRVMTKDNIGLAALLQTTPGAYDSDAKDCNRPSQSLLVCTAHIHWDPEYSDVKLIQTMMLMHELNSIVDSTLKRCSSMNNQRHDPNDIPLLLCGDFNSLPDSGVIEYLSSGRISTNHIDFKEFVYKDCLRKLCNSPRLNEFTHPFKIARAYEKDIMPFTNYSYEFKGTIDYVFYSTLNMKVIGVLGPLDPKWLQENHVHGCPHPFIPSDHFPILVELQLFPTPSTYSAVSNGVKQHR